MAQPNLSTILVVKYLVIALYTPRKPKPNKAINNENAKQTHTGISDRALRLSFFRKIDTTKQKVRINTS